MATYRVGIGSFNLKDGAVGIGTESSGLGNLKVEGTLKTTDLDVTGVSTFTRYAGFAADDININNRDVTLTGEHSTQGDIVVGLNSTFTVSTGATVTVGTVESVSIGTHFSPPIGGVEDRPEVPVEGTVRFNEDLNTLEFYNGVDWRQFTVNGASGRMLMFNGHTNDSKTSRIYSLQISTLGNATYFGDTSSANLMGSACASKTRGIYARGATPTRINTIDYVTIASEGNGIDFGDATVTEAGSQSGSSSTRGIFGGGSDPAYINTIDYIEIATTGNALDFGDLYIKTTGAGTACGNTTRLLFMGGYTEPSLVEVADIQAVTIASKGNSTKFGDLTKNRAHNGSFSNSVRGVCGGGTDYSNPHVNTIDYVTIASEGNAVNFGSLMTGETGYIGGGASTETRGVWMGGVVDPAKINTIQYIEIATTGNAMDFGDLPEQMGYGKQCSDSHGGLGGY